MLNESDIRRYITFTFERKLYPETIFYLASLTIMKKFILRIMTLFLASKINEVFPCFVVVVVVVCIHIYPAHRLSNRMI